MPVEYQIQGRLIVVVATGEHTFDDVSAAIRRAIADPQVAPCPALLIDARQGEVRETAANILPHVAFLESLQDRLSKHCAIVVSRAIDFGTGHVFAIYSEWRGLDVRIYKDFEAAKRWLESKVKE